MSADDPAQPTRRGARQCPICGKLAGARWRPFCSKRCADIDLGRWFGETYRIPVVEEEDGNDSEPEGGSEKGDED